MTSKTEILDAFRELKEAHPNEDASFAEIVAKIYKDKLVEIYVGDTYESLSTDQVSEDYPSVYCGIVEAAYGNALVVNCSYLDDQNHATFGHYVMIHGFSIVLVKEVMGKEGKTMEDLMDRSSVTRFVKSPK